MKFVMLFCIMISTVVSMNAHSYQSKDFFDRPVRDFPEGKGFGLSASVSTGYSSNVTELETGVSSFKKGVSVSSGYAFQSRKGRYLSFSAGRSKVSRSSGTQYEKHGRFYQLDAGFSINPYSKIRVELSSQSWTEPLNKNNVIFNEKGDQVILDYFSFNYNLGRTKSVGFLNLFYENKIKKYE